MSNKEKKEPTLWVERLTFRQAIPITILILAAFTIYTLFVLDKQLTPQTDVIVRVTSGTNGRTANITYILEGQNYSLRRFTPPVFGNLTARIERNKLGLSKDIEETRVVVSFYGRHRKAGSQDPVGVRLGANNYPKDFWYYWTLFSRSIHSIVGLISVFTLAYLCGACKKEGASITVQVICYVLAFLWVFSWAFIF